MKKIKEIIIGTNNDGKYRELCDLLPHRTKGQIRGRKDRLRLNRKRGKSWEDWEDEIIKKHWKKETNILKPYYLIEL